MVLKKIGTTPDADYADIGTAWAWLITQGGLLDTHKFTIVSDFTENTGVNGGAVDFNDQTVIIENPYGYAISVPLTKWYKFRDDTAQANINDTLILDGLIITTAEYRDDLISAYPNFASLGMTVYYKNLVLFGPVQSDDCVGIRLERWKNRDYIYNCKIYRFDWGISARFNDANTVGTEHYIENCAIYGCEYGLDLPNTTTAAKFIKVKNVVSAECSVGDFQSGGAHNTVTNCADSDNTIAACGAVLSGNITGITNADFKSVTSTDENFLYIDKNSDLYETGTLSISAGNTADIEGNPRPHPGNKVNIGVFDGDIVKTVRFTDASKGCPLTYDLDFGDGSGHAAALPADHEYDLTAIGPPYTADATLAITGSKGQTDSITKTINLLEA